MNVDELALITAVLAGLATLRFGVPLALTWLIGKAANRLTHAS